MLTVISRGLLATGIVLLVIFVADRLVAWQGQRSGIQAFEAAREARILAQTSEADGDRTGATRDIDAALAGENAADPGVASNGGGAPAGTLLAASLTEPEQSLWSEKRSREYAESTRSAPPGDAPAGILRIPAVGLELAVFTGTEELNLTRGAGTIEGTAPLGGRR